MNLKKIKQFTNIYIDKMEKQQKKINEKINKLSSKISSENINNRIKDINDRFINKDIKYQQANREINKQFNIFKLNKKINNISKKFKLNKQQAIKKYTNDEKKKIKQKELKKIDKEFKNIDGLNNIIDENKELERINKEIKKYDDKITKLTDIKLNSENFLITLQPFKKGSSKNNNLNFEINDNNYREIHNYNNSNAELSLGVVLPKNKYNDDDFIIIDFRHVVVNSQATNMKIEISEIINDLKLYADENENNNKIINAIFHLLSDDGIIIKIIFNKLNDGIDNKKKFDIKNIMDEELYGNVEALKDINIYNRFIDLKLNDNNEFVAIYNSEYINNNYNGLSCMVNIILEWKEYFEGKWNNGIKLYKTQPEMTYEGIYKYLYPNDEFVRGKPMRTTLKDCEKFFFAFGIHVRVYDIHNKEIYKFDSIKTNKHIPNNPLYLLYHNNHIQKITDVKSFSQIIINIQEKYNNKVMLLEKINFSINTSNYDNFIIINSTIEIINIIKKHNDNEEEVNLSFVSFEKLNTILFELYNTHKIMPYVKGNGTIINSINLRLKNNKKKIINVNIKHYENDGNVIEPVNQINKLVALQNLSNSVNNKILNNKYKSSYNDYTFKFVHYYRPKPLVIRLQEKQSNISYIDISKAYSFMLSKINTVPIFSLFNYPKTYDNHEINDFYIYLIEIIDDNNFIFSDKYTIIYGYNLKQINIEYNIIQFLEYTYLEKINTNEILDEIYNMEDQKLNMDGTTDNLINEKNRKFIANCLIGKLGQIKKCKEKMTLCATEKDAIIETNKNKGYYFKCINENNDKEILYFHVNKEYQRFKNGFLFLHMMIYDNMRITLNNIVNEMKENNIDIYGIKTDAIYFKQLNFDEDYKINNIINKYGNVKHEEEYEKDNNIFVKYHIRENIGKLKFNNITNEYDTIHMFNKFGGRIDNKFEDCINNINFNEIKVNDEYKINEIKNKTIIKAELPGCGKSTACKKFLDDNNYKGLFVINNNNLSNEIRKEGYDAITPYILLGCSICTDEYENETKKKFNIKEYDVIIYEEVYFNNYMLLHKLYELMLENNDKIFIANGDPRQLECCQDKITLNKKIDLINIMFPNYINLKIIKRCDSNIFYEIKRILDKYENFKGDRDDAEVIEFIIERYFKNKLVSDIGDIKNGICYTNETRTLMNNKIHKKIYGNNKFIIGQAITAKDYYKFSNDERLHRNYEYIIRNIENKIYTFEDENTNTLFQMEESLFIKYMDHTYIKTAHSSQGITLKEKYIIFDWKLSYASVKWAWVALTRTNNIDNIYFYNGKDNEIPLIETVNIISYKNQDNKAGRSFNNKDYIDLKWVSQQLKKQRYICALCDDVLIGLSVDRINGGQEAHLKSVCQITCINCNRRKR